MELRTKPVDCEWAWLGTVISCSPNLLYYHYFPCAWNVRKLLEMQVVRPAIGLMMKMVDTRNGRLVVFYG